jgi:hypothetical protein
MQKHFEATIDKIEDFTRNLEISLHCFSDWFLTVSERGPVSLVLMFGAAYVWESFWWFVIAKYCVLPIYSLIAGA